MPLSQSVMQTSIGAAITAANQAIATRDADLQQLGQLYHQLSACRAAITVNSESPPQS